MPLQTLLCAIPQNNICWRRDKDYFMSPVIQIAFHKDPSIVLYFCILQQHPVPYTQILIQANLEITFTYQSSFSEYCIWDVWSPLPFCSPFFESTPLTLILFSLSASLWLQMCRHCLHIVSSSNLISIHPLRFNKHTSPGQIMSTLASTWK